MPQFIVSLISMMLLTSAVSAQEQSLIDKAQEFRMHLGMGHLEMSQAYLASDARLWYGDREGDGIEWTLAPEQSDPWAGWNEHFKTSQTEVEWRAGDQSATLVAEETSEYYQLLERPAATVEMTYYFNDEGLINGLLVSPAADADQGLTAEFHAWAEANNDHEFHHLRPDGAIDPTGNHPPRFRALLDAWREDTGRAPID